MQFKLKEQDKFVLAKKLADQVVIDNEVLAVPGDYLVFGEHGQHELWPAQSFTERHDPTLTDQPPTQN